MYTVVNDIKRWFAVFSALFITVITTKVKGHDQCRPEHLMTCSKPLSVLTDSGLTFVTSKADLEKICPDLREAIKCIHKFSRHCMNYDQRKHFQKLFRGTGLMVHELCQPGPYQEEYLKHAPCMTQVEDQNKVCFKRYTDAMREIQANTPDMPEATQIISVDSEIKFQKRKREAADKGIKSVCCAFQEYVECSTHTVKRKCGEESADFSKRFLDKMSSSMIQLHCTSYGKSECGLSSSSSSSLLSSVLSVVLLTLLGMFLT